MARLPNFLVIIRSEKLSGKGQGRGVGVRKKERFVLGKRTFRSQKSKHFVLRIITFEIAAPVMSKKEYKAGEPVVLTTSVTNTGQYTGKETVQLYLQDVVSSVTRPVIELCGIRQVELAPGETRKIEFTLSEQELGFFNSDKQFVTEPGDFKLFVGSSSDNLKATEFELIKK